MSGVCMFSQRNRNPASGSETQKWTVGVYDCQIAVSTGVVKDSGEFMDSKVRHWSEFSQRSPASNGGVVYFISICDAMVRQARE